LAAIRKGIRKFRLTGGEPFLHPEIENILRFFSDRGVFTLVNTNGRHVVEHRTPFIELNDNVRIAVSLHTLNDASFYAITGTSKGYSKIVKGIEYLAETGHLHRLNMVVTTFNQNEVKSMIEYCRSLGCALKVHEIVAVPYPFRDRESVLIPVAPIERELRLVSSQVLPHEYSESFGIPCRRYVVNGVVVHVKSLGHGSRYDLEGLCTDCSHMPCHEGLYDLYVLPDGNVLPCRWCEEAYEGLPFDEQLKQSVAAFQRAEYVAHESE